jgi:hypothetical protein
MNELHQCMKDSTHPVVSGAKHCESYRGPPVELIKPVVYVTNAECPDCMVFQRRIRDFTGIDITVRMVA